MKKTLLASLLENASIQVDERQFRAKANANPFSKMVTDPSDIEDEFGMDDFVRRRSDPRGLDKAARTHTGPHSGVTGSRFKDMVRQNDDIDKDTSTPSNFNDDQLELDDDEDSLYLTTRDLSYARNEFDQERDLDDVELDVGKEFMKDLAAQNAANNPEDEEPLMAADEVPGDEEVEDDEFADLDPDMPTEDERFEGVVRAVKGAYLVSKKRQPDETYTEVWMYNVGEEFDDEANIRKAILSNTDIDPAKNFSEDGSQEAVMKTVGNVQFLTIGGLQD